MSRSAIALMGVLALTAVAVSRLGAQQPAATPPADAAASQPPQGVVVVTTAAAPEEAMRVRNLTVRTIGGRPFLVGATAEGRQLTATTPLVWIPVDAVLQMSEVGTNP